MPDETQVTPQNLQGPCDECGGYFPNLIAHFKSAHSQPTAEAPTQPLPLQPQVPQVPSGYVLVPADELQELVRDATQESLLSKVWNYSPGMTPSRHQRRELNTFQKVDRWLSGKRDW